MNNTILYVLAGVAILYIFISSYNKRHSKKRKSRKFMDGYKRKDKEES
ncbi:hypothetical protein [Eudoraea sp.]|jgi:hypothetical protein